MLERIAALPLAFAFGEGSFASLSQASLLRRLFRDSIAGGPTNYREENSDKALCAEGGELSGQMRTIRTEDVSAKMRSNFVSVDSIHFRDFSRYCLIFEQID